MDEDVNEYIKNCQNCQPQGKCFKKISLGLQNIPIPSEVMKQIGVDPCNLFEVDSFKPLIVCIDYISKWLEVKAIKDKSMATVASFFMKSFADMDVSKYK